MIVDGTQDGAGPSPVAGWAVRYSADGVHCFDRRTALNILFDEAEVPARRWSRAPRQVSIALLNACDLCCPHCYAPKYAARLDVAQLRRWLMELDAHGCLGVGFGGGEPTLSLHLPDLCRFIMTRTRMAVSITTHGHHLTPRLAEQLGGHVSFLRVSMDGTGRVYQRLRGRPFAALLERLTTAATIAPFGINFVVNRETLPCLEEALSITEARGGIELLLLPELPTAGRAGCDSGTTARLRGFVAEYHGPVRLSVSESGADGLPTCDPFTHDHGLRAYAHIDASAVVKRSSFDTRGVSIGSGSLLSAIERLSGEVFCS